MAHSICSSIPLVPALWTPRFTSHYTVRYNARPVLRPVRTAQKLSLAPRRSTHVVNSSFSFSTPVIKPDDHWSMYTALFSFAAFGIWSSSPPFSFASIFEFWQKGVCNLGLFASIRSTCIITLLLLNSGTRLPALFFSAFLRSNCI
jgi:hypothetical protein